MTRGSKLKVKSRLLGIGLTGLVALAIGCERSDTATPQDGAGTPVAQGDASSDGASAKTASRYPSARRSDHVDTYHGVKVPDPYRWLEDADSDATRAWIEAQNEVTFPYLEKLPARETIRARLRALWDYERWGVPSRQGKRYVVSKNDGLQDQSPIFVLDRLDAEPRLLLDPNTLSSDGTVALAGESFSHDGELMAYGVSASGSDWQTWRVREVATGKDRPDVIEWIKFSSVAWTKDGKGFFYGRYEAPKEGDAYQAINENEKVYYHRLGTPQSEDELVYARPDHPKWGFDPRVTEDGRYLVLEVKVGTDPNNDVFYQDLESRPGKDGGRTTHELVTGFSAGYSLVGNDRGTFWFRTDSGAPRGRLVAIDSKGKGDLAARTKELVPQTEDTLRSVRVVGNRFIASYLHDAHSRVVIHDLSGKKEREVELPGIGSTGGFSGRRADRESFFSFEAYTTPRVAYRLDPKSGEIEPFRQPKLAFDPSDYVTEQAFYASKDGTKIPISLSYKKGTKKTGDVPTYLYGYGGFDIALTPSFSVPNLVWMEMGGLLAVPNLRGGGEYGEAWHQAGTKLHKQNVFDDFIAAAEWLKAEGWTKPERLAIGGRSNGGLLVGAAMTQRPDLFAVALPGVGVMDMLRFNQFTIGWAWESDYGSPADPEEFQALFAYSPYHNLKEGTAYPATLVYTADHDDRVVPAHSFKFAAALQHAHAGEAPVLIRIDTKAGHGRGKPVSKTIDEWADLWAFTAENLGMTVPQAEG